MGLKERTGLLIGGIILIAFSSFYCYEIVHLPGKIIGFLLVGAGMIITAIVIRPVIRSPIEYAQIIYVDKNKNILGEGPNLEKEDVQIIERVLKKMAFPNLGIDEETHQTEALRIVSKHMKVIVYFLHNELDDEEPNYVKVGKYLFSVKLNNEEMQMIKDVLSNYETFGDKQ